MKKILSLSVTFLLNLAICIPVHPQMNYVEKKSKNQQETSSASMRGCRHNLPKLQVLAPGDHIALMGKKQTFLLNLSEIPPLPLKISILEPYVAEALWEQELKVEADGIFHISLPKTINLQPDKDYIFTATIPCEPEKPSTSSYVRVLFQKSSFQYQEQTPVKQVHHLLAEGIWYDALWIAYQNNLPEFKELLEMESIEINTVRLVPKTLP
jgi:hypothetical protein